MILHIAKVFPGSLVMHKYIPIPARESLGMARKGKQRSDVYLSERLASLGIMGDQLRTPEIPGRTS